MDVVSAYSYTSCAWHFIQAIPLVIWPQFINGLLTLDNETMQASNPSENYFARSLGLAQMTLGLVTIVLTGALPLTSMVETTTDSVPQYASAVVLLTTLHHAATAFYGWSKYNDTSQTGFLLGFSGSVVLAAFGVWCVLFGGDKSRISKRTGADKRTSGFPFVNREADKRKGAKGL